MGDRSGSREDRGPGCDLVRGAVLRVADGDVIAVRHDLVDVRAGPHPLAQRSGERVREGRRPAHDAAIQARADVPDEAEVADAGAGGDLLGLARRPGDRGSEEGLGVRWQRSHVLRERAVVLEVVDALLALCAGLARSDARGPGVSKHVRAHPRAGPDDCEPCGQREGEAQRVARDGPTQQEAPVHAERAERPGDPDGLRAGFVQQLLRRGARTREHVSSPVEDVAAAHLRPEAAAGARV